MILLHGVRGSPPPIIQMKKLKVREVTDPSLLGQHWDLDLSQSKLAPSMAQTSWVLRATGRATPHPHSIPLPGRILKVEQEAVSRS